MASNTTLVGSIPEVIDSDKQKKSFLQRVSPSSCSAERRLLLKIDASVLIFASLGYFIKNLDQSNVSSAFFAGMREDLSMYGNQLVHVTSCWAAGYVVGQVPSNLLLTRVSPRYVIPVLELAWGLATLGTFAVKNVNQLFAIRFLVGLFESGFYPGMHFILGSWYTPRELAKRAVAFGIAGTLGTASSSFLQTATYKTLNGVNGLAGWRWLMIVDAAITFPVALLGFFCLPDLPYNAKPTILLNQDDIGLARARMRAIGRKETEPWSREKLRRIFSSWYIWILPIEYVLWLNGAISSPIQYWLKSFNTTPPPVPGRRFSVTQIQLLPLPTTAIAIVCAFTFACLSDGPFKGRRYPFVYFGAVIHLILNTVWLLMPLYKNIPSHFAYFYLTGLSSTAGALILNWINEITGGDTELRALCVALANDLAYVVQAIAPNFVWKTADFPRAQKGYHYSLVLQTLLILWTSLILFLLRRDQRKAARRFQRPNLEAGLDASDSDISLTDIGYPGRATIRPQYRPG
ncbi:major facilitator superfamily domain-containing protein [Desarmillaria tabescens]|uniref:Major facilitator superfamily domain-containing protein n=1 Tax=Armillaria tabescens TaxID=1929756 RepID=A0AA39NC63_ARMTA|nr:major facilitator superfamily domain-containing protein [Desarmillaria tabescens]KAK0462844.1 major facilitator superfamily domain-containing protein [Desarmillaria tabescens]